jgi:hypothetical protein
MSEMRPSTRGGRSAGALAERRELEADHVEAVEQILTEEPFGDEIIEVAVGGRDHPDVHVDGAVLSERGDLLLLEGAEQLRLEAEGHLSDLVEEEGAAVGRLKATHALLRRARVGATAVTEELALHEGLGDGGTVHRDEGARSASARAVDGPRDQLLAGPGLAMDEDGAVARGDALEHREHREERGRLAQHLGGVAVAPRARARGLGDRRVGVDARDGLGPHHAGDGRIEGVHREGLEQVVVHPEAHRRDGRVDRGLASHHHRGRAPGRILDGGERVEPAAVGQPEVDQRDVGRRTAGERRGGLGHRAAGDHLVPLPAQMPLDSPPEHILVFEHQNCRHWPWTSAARVNAAARDASAMSMPRH